MRKYFSVRGGAGDLTKPDINTRPQDNLYLAVNSEWLSKAKIPADRTSTGINLILDMRIEDQLMKDFAKFADGKKEIPTIPNFAKATTLTTPIYLGIQEYRTGTTPADMGYAINNPDANGSTSVNDILGKTAE